MDADQTRLIDKEGRETTHPLRDLARGERFPRVLIKPGVPSKSIPSTVYAIDDGEMAKRQWAYAVYRETDALFI